MTPGIRARLAPALRALADRQGLADLGAAQHVRTLLRVSHRAYVLAADGIFMTPSGPGPLDEPQVMRPLLDLEASA